MIDELELISAEDLRASLSPASGVALSASEPELAEAKVTLGLQPRPEADSPGAVVGRTACSWCGRSDPSGGLTGSYPQPPGAEPAHVDNATDMHCADEESCQAARAGFEPLWIDSQFRSWRIDWQKYLAAQQYAAELASRSWMTGQIYGDIPYQLTGDEADPEFLAALSMLRDMVDERVPGFLEDYDRADEPVELSAPWPAVYDQPAAPPPWAMFDPWGHTMRNPAHRQHTLGHMRASHQGVHSAADALGRKAVLNR